MRDDSSVIQSGVGISWWRGLAAFTGMLFLVGVTTATVGVIASSTRLSVVGLGMAGPGLVVLPIAVGMDSRVRGVSYRRSVRDGTRAFFRLFFDLP
jgi:hypothetical protein